MRRRILLPFLVLVLLPGGCGDGGQSGPTSPVQPATVSRVTLLPVNLNMSVGDLEHLQVETTDLNEIDAAEIAEGDVVTITFDALEDVLEGTVVSVAPKASEGSGVNYTVVVKLDDWPEGLRWGMTAFVDIEIE